MEETITRPCIRSFVYVDLKSLKNFENCDIGKNDKEPGAITQRSVTTARMDRG